VAAESAAGPQGDPLAVAAAGNIRISPKARRLAKEYFVDITTIKGTGPGGEIVAEDVLAVTARTAAPAAPAATPVAASSTPAPTPAMTSRAPAEVGALTSIGRIMAERTTQSWTTTPHFFVSRDVDCTELVAARKRFGPDVERTRGVKLTYTDLLTAIVAQTLRKHPRMNASWTGDTVKP